MANELFPEERAGSVADCYSRYREQLQSLLESATQTLASVTSASWKLDFYVTEDRKDIRPVFLVTLRTRQNGSNGRLEFVCTHEEMEDLVTKLKDAQQQIARSASHV